jgi:hypothetical protein
VAVHACNPSYLRGRDTGMVVHACNPAYVGGRGRRTLVLGQPQTISISIWKITKAERVRGMVQVVEHKVLSSNPSTVKKILRILLRPIIFKKKLAWRDQHWAKLKVFYLFYFSFVYLHLYTWVYCLSSTHINSKRTGTLFCSLLCP